MTNNFLCICQICKENIKERPLFVGLLKKIQRRRKDLCVIVCSATLDAQKMVAFFNLIYFNYLFKLSFLIDY